MKQWKDKNRDKRLFPIMKIRGNQRNNSSFPCACDWKYDGEFEWAWIDASGKAVIFNKYGNYRTDCSITDDLERLDFRNTLFIGEHVGMKRGKNGMELMSFYRGTLKALKSNDEDRLHLFIFDILKEENIDLTKQTYFARRSRLEELKIETGRIHLSKMTIIRAQSKIQHLLRNALQAGCDGVVLKNLNSTYFNGETINWIKVKHKKTADLILQSVHKTKKSIQLGAFLNGSISKVCNCSGFSNSMHELLKDLARSNLTRETHDLLIVNPSIMIEINYLERIPSKNFIGYSLRSPTFSRIRPDKTISEVSFDV